MSLDQFFRLDALPIALLPLLVSGTLVALARADRRWWQTLLGAALAGLALSALDLRLAAAALVGVALVAGHDRWSRSAGLLQAAALLWLGGAAQTWRWNDLAAGAAFRSSHVLLLLLGGLLALGLLPLRVAAPQPPRVALALTGLYPLLRMYELGPINWGWTLAAAFGGAGAAGWLTLAALRAADDRDRARLLRLAWWGVAFAPITLATEAGLTATWALALTAVLMDAALAYPPRSTVLYPLLLAWLALWLGSAAALAGGVPLLAAALWLLTIGLLLALGQLRRAEAPAGWRRALAWALAVAGALAGLGLPKLIELLVQPIWTQLGAGLTPFGRMTLWPWIGLSVRNAGSQTVATLPSLALAGMLLVAAALGYLLTRLWELRAPSAAPPAAGPGLKSTTLWALIARNLPTAKRTPATKDSPDDI
jgi:hypothetical protein